MLLAIAHVGGTVVVLFVLGMLNLWLFSWESERYAKRRLEAAALSFGVTVEDLEQETMMPRVVQWSADRFSSDLLRNRLSDFCGLLRTLWGWLGSLAQLLVLGAVIWNIFSSGPEVAVLAWIAVGVSIFFWVAGAALGFACLLLTGRLPGEASAGRKALGEYLQKHTGARA